LSTAAAGAGLATVAVTGTLLSTPVAIGLTATFIVGSTVLGIASLAAHPDDTSIHDAAANLFKSINELAAQNLEGLKKFFGEAVDQAGEGIKKFVDELYKDPSRLFPALGEFFSPAGGGGSLGDLIDDLQKLFDRAKGTASPLILDLDGDGVETTDRSLSGVLFDSDKNGFAEQTGWVGKDDGLLVRDLNGDGQISNGGELLGNHTLLKSGAEAVNGFEALKDLDSNADGLIDGKDAAFNTLNVWKDFNQNGTTEAGELLSMSDAGVKNLKVAYTNSTTTDAQGNAHLQLGSYTKTDGSTQKMNDVWFSVDTARTLNLNPVIVSADIAELPDVAGMGNVASLRQAMAKDSTGQLKGLVQQWLNSTAATRDTVINNLIYRWAGVQDVDPASRGPYIDARKLAAIEALMGERFFQNGLGTFGPTINDPGIMVAEVMLSIYSKFKSYVEQELNWPSEQLLLDKISLQLVPADATAAAGSVAAISHFALDVSALAQALQERFVGQSMSEAIHDLVLFQRGLQWHSGAEVLKALKAQAAQYTSKGSPEFVSLLGTTADEALTGTENADYLTGGNIGASALVMLGFGGNDTMYGSNQNDMLSGGLGADHLVGGNGNDSLHGNEHNDKLYGDAGNDTLDGGSGNDYLSGGMGADTYVFAKGSGQDTIYNYDDDAVGTNADTILLGAGITTTGVTLTRQADDLIISLNGSDDSMLVQSYFHTEGASRHVVENLKFADGTVWNVATIKTKVLTSTAGDDMLTGYATNDTINAGAGNDTVYGNAGNDTLDGGSGNDYLSGGTGADTYVFAKGSGQDTIYNHDGEAVGTNADTILLGAGITTTGVTLTRQADDLIISLNGSDDSMLVQSYFNTDGASSHVVENLKFADGTVWNVATIKTKVLTSTAGNDTLTGYATADTINAGDGNDTVSGQAGHDVLDGGTGADNVQGGEGNDTVRGGIGNDTLSGGNGNDSLQGNEHNDELYGDAGNDTLDGGSGNDYLRGGTGADTYVFAKGSGQDTIYNHDGEAVGTNADTILLGAGITTTGVTLTRQADDLIISLNGSDDSMLVQSYFNTDGASSHVVENLKFADGTVWNVATIKTKVLTSTAGNDTLTGYATADTINAGDGNDTVSGQAGHDVLDGGTGADNVQGGEGNDTVRGGTGNDTLSGDAGNDTLDGGSGNDYLSGGTGADTYVFAKGSGQDTIYNHDGEAVGTNADTILLGAGITTTGVTLTRQADDLIISLNGSDDSMLVQSYFNTDGASSHVVENLKFADGTVWNVATIKTKVLTSTAGNDTLTGYATADTINAGDGNDTVSGQAGHDVLDGGTGADNVQGGEGNDTVRGGIGNDTLSGGNGNDNLQGQDDNDNLFGDAGNDTLDGGTGNDYLRGGTGADTYVFAKGSGQDTIYNHDGEAVGTNADTILLGAGITTTGVTLTRQADDLIISLNGSDDRLIVQSYFNTDGASSFVVENLRFADRTVWNYATVKANLSTTPPPASITVNGAAANENLTGGLGNDTVFGNAGNDTLDGGLGNDTLDGGAGNDIYLFGKGSGKDTISAYDGTVGKVDLIQLGAGVLTTDVVLKREGDDLVLSINGTTDTLRVNYYFNGDATTGYQVEQIKFADGTVWNVTAVKTRVLTGTSENDTLTGYASADTLSGLAGDDTLNGGAGNDTLDGGAGEDQLYGEDGDDIIRGGTQNDVLVGGNGNDNLQGQDGDDTMFGEAGNDTLDGGLGNDTLDGGAGNDIYLFGKGSGNDTINAYDVTVGKVDLIQLGAGVRTTDVVLKREGDHLVLSINGTTDTLRVIYYFNGDATTGYQVEQIKFADGTVWNVNAIKTRVLTGTSENDTLTGYASADTLSGLAGDDTLNGGAGNDTLDGGLGNDTLDGGAGNDIYLFGKGSGNDTINAYDVTVGKVDLIQLGAGVRTTDVVLKREGDHLVLSINGTTDTLRVIYYFNGDATTGYQVEQIKFADGTVWNVNAIKTRVLTGTSENDTLTGYASADTLSGLAGDDTLNGGAGNDTLDGGAGEDHLNGADGDDIIRGGTQNDVLVGGNGNDNLQGQDGDDTMFGEAGNDTLDGGLGNDTLDGGAGNDIYLFGKGSGKDFINNYDSTGTENDRVVIGAGVSENQIWLQRTGNDLQLTLIETNDKLTVSNWYSGSAYRVDGFNLGNGKLLLESQVDALVSAMAAFAPPAAGQTTLPADYQTTLNSVIAANWK
jgi:Ca2+-binding RTX toxin-like protein